MGRKKIKHYGFEEGISLEERLQRALHLFELDGAARVLPNINAIAEAKKLSYYEFLERLLDEEFQRKEDLRIERWRRQARFPFEKPLESYNFEAKNITYIDKERVLRLAECSWIETGGNVIFFGPPGLGKTHLSIALGLKAIEKSHETKFTTVDRLTEAISIAAGKDEREGVGQHRKALLNSIANVPLLILDELAYSKITPEVSHFLFQVVLRRNSTQKSTILTANEPFQKWGKIFGEDTTRTTAMIDRLLEDCVVVTIKGSSYRLRNFADNNKTLKTKENRGNKKR